MKQIIYIGLLSVIVSLLACDFEISSNGKLDGNWQLARLDTLAPGTLSTSASVDMRGSGVFWCVQHRLIEIMNVNQRENNVFFRFEKTENTLRLWNPVSDNRTVSDSLVTSPSTLQPFGIQKLDETLLIEEFSSDAMVLRNERLRFHLLKF